MKHGILTAIDGGGESTPHPRKIRINDAGLIDISATPTVWPAAPDCYETALGKLSFEGKRRLYAGLQKEISTCLKNASLLLARKNELYQKGDFEGAEIVYMQYKTICERERRIWKQIKMLYEMLEAR